jgi:pyridoxamine 5'-phosphate oxidase
MKDLRDYRKNYEKKELIENQLPDNPIVLFNDWFQETEAAADEGDEVNAMTVSTFGLDGYPKSRVVLLKMVTEEGFIFFTNYQSQKGHAIAHNPKVCLSFFWPSTERQVIIKGIAEKTTEVISDAYFKSRPLGSRLGAVASEQSVVIPSRQFLEDKLSSLLDQYADGNIPRPENWGGYLVRPVAFEFWQGRANRLHDRILYEQQEHIWHISRLSP